MSCRKVILISSKVPISIRKESLIAREINRYLGEPIRDLSNLQTIFACPLDLIGSTLDDLRIAKIHSSQTGIKQHQSANGSAAATVADGNKDEVAPERVPGLAKSSPIFRLEKGQRVAYKVTTVAGLTKYIYVTVVSQAEDSVGDFFTVYLCQIGVHSTKISSALLYLDESESRYTSSFRIDRFISELREAPQSEAKTEAIARFRRAFRDKPNILAKIEDL